MENYKKRKMERQISGTIIKKLSGGSSKKAYKRVNRDATFGPELKEFTVYAVQTGVTVGGAVSGLAQITQGTDVTNRIGRQVYLKYVDIQLQLFAPTNGVSDYGLISLVWDRDANGVVPTYTTIFDATIVADRSLMFRNTASERDRFKVLKQWRFGFTPSSSTVPGDPNNVQIMDRFHYNFKGNLRKTEYNGVSSIPESGGLYLAFGSKNNVVSTLTGWSYSFTSKLIFTDA